jgi:flagellar biosynthesis protein
MRKKEDLRMAASIRYDKKKDDAPRLTAKGRGLLADRIIELARKHDIPVKEDPALVSLLCRLDIDEEIPPELFRAVAEILAFVYSTNERYRLKLEESR